MRKTFIVFSVLLLASIPLTQAGVEAGAARSAMEWNRSTFIEFGEYQVMTSSGEERHVYRLCYPRVKKLANGDLIMVFQDGQHSWDILYMRSPDGGRTWSQPEYLVERQPVSGDTRCFATADAIQLANGWLVVAYSFRYSADFKRSNNHSGIEVRISKDNGYTWSEPIIAYRGANWEPSLLQLPSGELQLYYTQRGPYHESALNDPRFSVDVGLVRSHDNGYTWIPRVDGPPWKGERLSQNEGQDGMAVAAVLEDGQGIVYVCESWHASNTGPWVVWSSMEANWDYPDMQDHLTAEGLPNFGPWDRRWVVHESFRGWAPYIVRVETGETVVSSNGNFKGGPPRFQVFVGDETARNFSAPSIPFPMSPGGWWGSLAVKDDNTLIAVSPIVKGPDIYNGWDERKHIVYTEGHFIRDFDIVAARGIVVDGKLGEGIWDSGSFLFMGSDSDANAYVKAAYDKDNLYLGIEVHDKRLWARLADPMMGDSLNVYIDVNNEKAGSVGEGVFRIDIAPPNYLAVMRADNGGKWLRVSETGQVAADVHGTFGDYSGADIGYTLECAIPWSLIGGLSETGELGITAVLRNNDTGGIVYAYDIVGDTVAHDPSTWFTLTLAKTSDALISGSINDARERESRFWFRSERADVHTGVVQSSLTGRAISGVRLWLKDVQDRPIAAATTDVNGRFRFVAPSGTQVLRLEGIGTGVGEDEWFAVSSARPIPALAVPGAAELISLAQLASVSTSSTEVGNDGSFGSDRDGNCERSEGGAWKLLEWEQPQRASTIVITGSAETPRASLGRVLVGDETSPQPLAVVELCLPADPGLPLVVHLPDDQDITWLKLVVDKATGEDGLPELLVVGHPKGAVWLSSPWQGETLSDQTPIRVETHGVNLTSVEISLDGELLYRGQESPDDVQLRPSALSEGSHVVALLATDEAGRMHRHTVRIGVKHFRLTVPDSPSGMRGETIIGLEQMIPADQIEGVNVTLCQALGDEIAQAVTGTTYIAFSSDSMPGQLAIDTLVLADGAYDLSVEIVTTDGITSSRVLRVLIDNWNVIEDAIEAPEDSGWFGIVERMATVDKSAGWQHVGGNPIAFFGDEDRIRSDSGSEEYLTWRLPGLRRFTFTLYALDPWIQQQVRIQLSDDGKHWMDFPYAVDVTAPESRSVGSDWLKLDVYGHVPKGVSASFARIVVSGSGKSSSRAMQVGHVRLEALK